MILYLTAELSGINRMRIVPRFQCVDALEQWVYFLFFICFSLNAGAYFAIRRNEMYYLKKRTLLSTIGDVKAAY